MFTLKRQASFLVILILLFATRLYGQQAKPDAILLHLSKRILVSSGNLNYSAYHTNTQWNTQANEIVYFELSDAANNVVYQWKTWSINGILNGQITIPETINNGLYYLTAFTRSMLCHSESISIQYPVLIQRIYESPPKNISVKKLKHYSRMSFVNKNAILVNYSKNNREIELQSTENTGIAYASMSVTELTPFDSILCREIELQERETTSGLKTKRQELLVISGTIRKKSTELAIKDKLVYLTYPDTNLHFEFTKTNERGEFCFYLDSIYDNRNITLLLNDNNLTKDNVQWILDENHRGSNAKNTDLYALKPKQQDFLNQIKERELISMIFSKSVNKLAPYSTTNSVNFFAEPDYTIFPSDFVDLKNFNELCDNLLNVVRYKKSGDKTKIGIVLNTQKVVWEDVLICINGLPVSNIQDIDNLGSNEIEKIEIVHSEIMYGELNYNGIVSIYLNNNEDPLKRITSPLFTFYNKIENIKSCKTAPIKDREPNVVQDILWEPAIVLKPNKKQSFSIQFPDTKKEYRLYITGITDSGEIIEYEEIINTEK